MEKRSPAETYRREKPMRVKTTDGNQIELFVASGGVSSSGPARVSNAHWIMSVNRVEYMGPPASIDETEDEVIDAAERWWQANKIEVLGAHKGHNRPKTL